MAEKQDKFTNKTLEYLRGEMAIQPKELTEKLMIFIYEHVKRLERDGVIFGLSGGLDSAVLAELCVKAVGAEKTMALLMPEKDSKREHVLDARKTVKRLGIKSKELNMAKYLKTIGLYKIFPLDTFVPKRYRTRLVDRSYKYYESIKGASYFSRTLIGSDTGLTGAIVNRSIAYYRAKHRMRMLLLYMYGEKENRLVAGAANKTEYLIGYFVKHGIDSATDIMPIMGLYKTQVIELAKYLSVPVHIIKKSPSPDIISGLVDETAIGLPYERLDLILLAIEKGWSDEDMEQAFSEINITQKDIVYVRQLMRQSEHMRTVYTAV
jgi:NAD+ synthase